MISQIIYTETASTPTLFLKNMQTLEKSNKNKIFHPQQNKTVYLQSIDYIIFPDYSSYLRQLNWRSFHYSGCKARRTPLLFQICSLR